VSTDPTPAEIADRYAEARARVVALVAEASPNDLATPVPGTPEWTVHGLLSHMVGCPVDMVAGRFEGAGSPEWTQRQVDERANFSLDQLLAEWDTVAPVLDTAIRGGAVPSPASFDLITHESDLRGALGLPNTPDPLAVRFVADGFGARAYSVAANAGLPSLQLRATDSDWSIGEPGGVTAAATEYEWARALSGRRSNAQVSGYDWSGDPAPYLDLLCPFGPLRPTDCSG
jgi:uncharacterized protein (TIGR03083 family)